LKEAYFDIEILRKIIATVHQIKHLKFALLRYADPTLPPVSTHLIMKTFVMRWPFVLQRWKNLYYQRPRSSEGTWCFYCSRKHSAWDLFDSFTSLWSFEELKSLELASNWLEYRTTGYTVTYPSRFSGITLLSSGFWSLLWIIIEIFTTMQEDQRILGFAEWTTNESNYDMFRSRSQGLRKATGIYQTLIWWYRSSVFLENHWKQRWTSTITYNGEVFTNNITLAYRIRAHCILRTKKRD